MVMYTRTLLPREIGMEPMTSGCESSASESSSFGLKILDLKRRFRAAKGYSLDGETESLISALLTTIATGVDDVTRFQQISLRNKSRIYPLSHLKICLQDLIAIVTTRNRGTAILVIAGVNKSVKIWGPVVLNILHLANMLFSRGGLHTPSALLVKKPNLNRDEFWVDANPKRNSCFLFDMWRRCVFDKYWPNFPPSKTQREPTDFLSQNCGSSLSYIVSGFFLSPFHKHFETHETQHIVTSGHWLFRPSIRSSFHSQCALSLATTWLSQFLHIHLSRFRQLMLEDRFEIILNEIQQIALLWNDDIADYHKDNFTEFRNEMCRMRLLRFIPDSIFGIETTEWFTPNFMSYITRGGYYEEQLSLVEWSPSSDINAFSSKEQDKWMSFSKHASCLIKFFPRPWSIKLLSGCIDRCLRILFDKKYPYSREFHSHMKISAIGKCKKSCEAGEKFSARLVHVAVLESAKLGISWTKNVHRLGGQLGPLVNIAECLFGRFTI